MNEYYHAFTIGFNYWYILMILSIATSVMFGLKQYRLSKRGRIEKMFSNLPYKVLTGISTAIFMVLFLRESTSGLIQLLDNGLARNESAAWSMIVFPVVYFLIVFAYAFIIYYSGRFVACFKLATLKEMRH